MDQLILCSIYAVCKVVESEIPFKHLVAKYGELFGNLNQRLVCREALLAPERRGSIIAFYNEVYMPLIKSFVLELSPANRRLFPPVFKSIIEMHLSMTPSDCRSSQACRCAS